ncbi:MAG: CBS domain-containing protein [Phycisphaerales bacterium]|nr:CBS domain-containing protein [Phycisphaerales bacterium]
MQTRLEDIMTTHVVTVSMDATLAQIQRIFLQFRFHHVVVTEDGKAVGVLSDRDLLKNVSPFVGKLSEQSRDTNSLKKKAHQVMTRGLVCAPASMLAADAALMLLQNNISCLPILDAEHHCIGIVTWRDLLRWASRAMGHMSGPDEDEALAA